MRRVWIIVWPALRVAKRRADNRQHLVTMILTLRTPPEPFAPFRYQRRWNSVSELPPVELPEMPADLHEVIMPLEADQFFAVDGLFQANARS